MSRAAAGLAVAAAASLLAVGGIRGPGNGWPLALAVGGALIAVWAAGTAGHGREPPGERHRRRRVLLDRAATAILAASLGGGLLLAAGIGEGTAAWGLPRSLWGLSLGVWLIPLVVTSLGFAVSFRAPRTAAEEPLRSLADSLAGNLEVPGGGPESPARKRPPAGGAAGARRERRAGRRRGRT